MAVVLTKAQRKANKLIARHRMSLLRGGSRSGKTFVLCRAVATRAIRAPATNHCIFRLRRNAIKGTVWKTLKDVMAKCFPGVPYKESISDLTITLPNGSVIMAAGLDDAERVDKILGMEFSTVYFNECTQIPWASVETALSRLAELSGLRLRAYFDCNPTTKLHWTYHLFVKKLKPGTREPWDEPHELAEMKINPDDNRENISAEYFKVLDQMGAAKRKRFRDGEWSEDTEGALWTLEGLEAGRVAMGRVPDLVRVVVAVDPSGTSGAGEGAGDDIGIVVAGLGVDGRWYVLADRSCNLSPAGWGRRVVEAFREWNADRVVGETNFGGAMVQHVIKSVDASIPFKEVKASRGKIARAEPISALYEEGKVSHVGSHPDLEDQMCAMTSAGFIGEGSPDRADALVWAITELSGKTRREPGVRRL
jgi:phage terminase large subunit-like protein